MLGAWRLRRECILKIRDEYGRGKGTGIGGRATGGGRRDVRHGWGWAGVALVEF